MPEARLQRTRESVEPDPVNRLAKIYLQHASELLRNGRAKEARLVLLEAARLLGDE